MCIMNLSDQRNKQQRSNKMFNTVEVVEVIEEFSPEAWLVVRPSEGRSWDFRPYGQSLQVRKHRIARSFLRSNNWKVTAGLMSRKAAKKAAKQYASRVVAEDACAGCKCAVRMGSETWIAIL